MKNVKFGNQVCTLPVLLVMFAIGLYTMAKFDPQDVSASNMDAKRCNDEAWKQSKQNETIENDANFVKSMWQGTVERGKHGK